MQKLISIIVPVFNVQSFLPQCLQSVVSQSYQNLEILLVDDGSTDGSGAVCDEWAERDPRIRVIHTENRGVAAARNEGLKTCSGDLIGFVDADDWIEKDMYMCLSEACESADMASCGWVDYAAGMNKPAYRGKKQLWLHDFEEAVIRVYEKNGFFTSIWNKLYQRDVMMPGDEPILFDQDLYIGEDELWLIRIMKNCDSFAFISKPYYHYRPRVESATKSFDEIEKRMTALLAKNRTIQELEGYGRAALYAKSGIFNECVCLKIQSYIRGKREKQERIQQVLKRFRLCWLRAPNFSMMNKMKMLLIELEMKLRLPAGLVQATNNVRRCKFSCK